MLCRIQLVSIHLLSICISVSEVDVSESAVRAVVLIMAFIRSSCLPGWNFSLQVGAGIVWLLDTCQHQFTVEGKHTRLQYTLHLSLFPLGLGGMA